MKSPFLVLILFGTLVGVAIGVAAIFLFGSGSGSVSVSFADENSLPTPTGPISIQISETTLDAEDSRESAALAETGVGGADSSVETTSLPDGFGDVGALQQMMADNPDIAALLEKAQTGDLSQEEQAKLREFMVEVMESSGFAPPGAGGGGFAAPTSGFIAAIEGSILTLTPSEEGQSSSRVEISEDTPILIVKQLTIEDLISGDAVTAVATRSADGRNLALSVSVSSTDADSAPFGAVGIAASGGREEVTPVRGDISAIDGEQLIIETNQGPLRVAVGDETLISSTSQGSLSDLAEGMAMIAFGQPGADGELLASNVVAGPGELLNEVGSEGIGLRGFRGSGRGRGTGQGQ